MGETNTDKSVDIFLGTKDCPTTKGLNSLLGECIESFPSMWIRQGENFFDKTIKVEVDRCSGQTDCCTSSDPCGTGEGECKSDSDCETGLMCGYHNCKKRSQWWDRNKNCCTKKNDKCERCDFGKCDRDGFGKCVYFNSHEKGFHCKVTRCPTGKICWEYDDDEYYTEDRRNPCRTDDRCERCDFGKCDRDGFGKCVNFNSREKGFHCKVTRCPTGKSCWEYDDDEYYTEDRRNPCRTVPTTCPSTLRSAKLSSTRAPYKGERCVDGDFSNFCHTHHEQYPFLVLEYGKPISVS